MDTFLPLVHTYIQRQIPPFDSHEVLKIIPNANTYIEYFPCD